MLFCPKCGSILKPVETKNGRAMKCPNCGFISNEKKARITEQIVEKKKIEIVEQEEEILPKTKEICPKCKNTEAYYWLVQTRAGDEAATKFYKCTKCGHVWRDYG
jgi:DNA-directed RNA polymerase subunit M